jgi:putative transposase
MARATPRYRRGKSYNADNKYNRSKHEIRLEFIRNFKRYGSRQIKASLEQKGIKLGRKKVSEIMRTEGLRAIQPPKFILGTTDSKHGKGVCDNLLLNKPKPAGPNQVWVSDITYMPLKGGKWAYLATCGAARADGFVLKANSWLGSSRQYVGKPGARTS